MIKTTCFDCNQRQKTFCRRRNIAKNSPICELVQANKFSEVKEKIG